MPEMPDVEVFKRYVDSTSLRQRISSVQTLSPSLLKATSPQGLGRRLKGQTLGPTRRHGKFLFIRAGRSGWLVLHFGMTGTVVYSGREHELPQFAAFIIRFDNGFCLTYTSARKLGQINWTDEPDAFIEAKRLGPDAADVTLAQLRELAAQRRGGVKSWLMDQTAVAGIGNVYSDEILFRARLHPSAQVQRLDQRTLARLHRAMVQVLRQAVRAGADPDRMPKSFLLPRREQGARCPGCGGPLNRIASGGRRAYYCPRCQTKP